MIYFSGVLALTGCQRQNYPESSPYMHGFETIAWKATSDRVDTLIAGDPTWEEITSLVRSETLGKVVVLKHARRNYYLEFDKDDRFFSMNYLSGKDDMDSVMAQIAKFYGAPDRIEKLPTYQRTIWEVETVENDLTIEFIETRTNYEFRVNCHAN